METVLQGVFMNKIQSLSSKMRILFAILFFLAPIFTITYWTFYEFFADIGIKFYSFELSNQLITINAQSKALAILVTFIPTAIIMIGLFKLKKLFTHYAQNKVFTEENVIIFRDLGWALFALVIGDMITTPLLSLALSFQNPVGSRFISATFGSSEIIHLIIGFMVLIISYVMREAYELDVDARHTI